MTGDVRTPGSAACRRGLQGCALALFATLATLSAPAQAQVFVYKDKQGGVWFTDSPIHGGYRPYRVPGVSARQARPTRAWDGVIRRAGEAHGVRPGLIKAVIHAESGFDPRAVSYKGAQGLMQLMPLTARALGVDDPFNAWENIEGGTKHLSYLVDRYRDLPLALAAYNAGGEAVDRYRGIPPYRETRDYVKRVLALSEQYDADFR